MSHLVMHGRCHAHTFAAFVTVLEWPGASVNHHHLQGAPMRPEMVSVLFGLCFLDSVSAQGAAIDFTRLGHSSCYIIAV